MSFQFRRGAAAIEEAATRKSGGGSFSFVPQLRWREDGEHRYVLVLTPIEDVPTVLLHEWIPVGKREKANGEEYTKWESFISRKDPAIGEDYDELEERLERDAKLRAMGVVVELEPVFETVKGRDKVVAFKAMTSDYVKRDEDDGDIEMTQPEIKLVIESAITVWGGIGSLDQSRGPISELPIEITRRGKDQNTRYDIFPLEAPVDLSPIMENLEGLSYLADELDDIEERIAKADNDLESAQIVAEVLLSKYLDELADGKRYTELVEPLKLKDMPKKWGDNKAKKKMVKKERPARKPQRETVAEPTPAASEDDVKQDRFAQLKAQVESS